MDSQGNPTPITPRTPRTASTSGLSASMRRLFAEGQRVQSMYPNTVNPEETILRRTPYAQMAPAVLSSQGAISAPIVQRELPNEPTTQALEGTVQSIDDPKLNPLEMIRCPVCQDNIKDIRLTCGHMVCKNCATQLHALKQKCPICRKDITSMDKVYYNKYLKYKNKYFQLKTKGF